MNWCKAYDTGRNCPEDDTIKTEKTCKLAANALSLKYATSVRGTHYAAGCFWIQGAAFFNRIVDPSLTYHERFLRSGGVCFNRSTVTLILLAPKNLNIVFIYMHRNQLWAVLYVYSYYWQLG